MYEDEDGDYLIDANAAYYGETQFTMEYKNKKGKPFDWLYIDFNSLKQSAEFCGMQCELVLKGNHFDYLARITK